MKHYCGRDKPLTRAKTTVEAFKYFLHVCRGTLKLAHTMESPLINGMAVEHMTGMGTRKQSAELSVESMLVLEELVHHGALEEVRRMIVGGGILCAYLRSAFFDSNQITSVTLEKKVMATQVELTKTCRNDKDRLPKFMLAPRNTISGLDVLASHLSWREKIGVPLGPYPMFPAYGAEGWLKDAAELADVNAVLKAVFGELKLKEVNATTHMFKTMFLAVVSKAGVARDVQRTLGYHKDASSSVRAYARDILGAPVEKMAEVIKHISEGLFFPDAPAGERWKSGNAPTRSSSSSASSESSREESEVEELSDAESIDGTGFGNNLLARSLGKDCKERDSRLFCYMKTGRIHCGLSSSLTHTFSNTLITSCKPMASG